MAEERVYVIPLRKARRASRNRRSARAAKLVREFLQRHMKTENVKLSEELNRKLWERGAKRTPSRVRVRAVPKEDGSVEAILAEGKLTKDEIEAAEKKPKEKPEAPAGKQGQPEETSTAEEAPEPEPKPEEAPKGEAKPEEKPKAEEAPKEEPKEENPEESGDKKEENK